MNAIQSKINKGTKIIWLAFGLAMTVALVYLLIFLKVLGTADYDMGEAPGFIKYIAIGGYILGGLLVLVRRRWLWIIGLFINSLVIFIYFSMHKGDIPLFLSFAGLSSKFLQLLLEFALIFLIFTYPKKKLS